MGTEVNTRTSSYPTPPPAPEESRGWRALIDVGRRFVESISTPTKAPVQQTGPDRFIKGKPVSIAKPQYLAEVVAGKGTRTSNSGLENRKGMPNDGQLLGFLDTAKFG